MIKAIAFDYTGVVELSNYDVIGSILQFTNFEKDVWKRSYSKVVASCNSKGKTWEEIIILTAHDLKMTKSQISEVENILMTAENSKKINQDIIKVIEELKSNNFKIGLVSNCTTSLRQRLKDQKIYNLFDAVVLSGEIGFSKPDPRIFEFLINSFGVLPSDMLVVDDSEKTFVNAEEVGFVPLVYRNIEKFKEDLSLMLGSKII